MNDFIDYKDGKDVIKVKRTIVWPIIEVDNDNIDLLDNVIKKEDSESMLLSTTCFSKKLIDFIEIKFKLLHYNYEIQVTDNIDSEIYIGENNKDYYVGHYNKINETNSGYEIYGEDLTFKNNFVKIVTYYKNNIILGIVEYYIENNLLHIKEVFADDVDNVIKIINKTLSDNNMNAQISCSYNEKMLKQALDKMDAKLLDMVYRYDK